MRIISSNQVHFLLDMKLLCENSERHTSPNPMCITAQQEQQHPRFTIIQLAGNTPFPHHSPFLPAHLRLKRYSPDSPEHIQKWFRGRSWDVNKCSVTMSHLFFFGNSYPYHDGDVAVRLLMHCSKEIKRNHGLCLQMSGVSPVFA